MRLRYNPSTGWKLLGASLLCGAVCYGYVGYYALYHTHSAGLYGAAWAALAAFAVTSLASLRIIARSWKGGVAVEFTEEGILNHRGKWPLIRWDQIARIGSGTVQYSEFLYIQPAEGIPPSIKLDPDGTTSFGFTGLIPGKDAVFAWLAEHHPELVRRG